ncbi:uncharacterized protein BDW70DRAFT_127094 [Aspergillus foveolatus]|uniref:uncharacterized protein n=1 Tax=Aspergillus foveolatus TaxID=210207 RepID=UPI003CCDDB8E
MSACLGGVAGSRIIGYWVPIEHFSFLTLFVPIPENAPYQPHPLLGPIHDINDIAVSSQTSARAGWNGHHTPSTTLITPGTSLVRDNRGSSQYTGVPRENNTSFEWLCSGSARRC